MKASVIFFVKEASRLQSHGLYYFAIEMQINLIR